MNYIPKAVGPVATCVLCHGTGQQAIKGHTFNHPALGHPVALMRCECVEAQIEDEKRRWREAITHAVACMTCTAAAGTACMFTTFERLDSHGHLQELRGHIHAALSQAVGS